MTGDTDTASFDPDRSELEQLLDSCVDPILAIDESGSVTMANPAVERVFGWRRSDLIGQKVNVLMGEPYRGEHDGYLQRFLETGERRAIGRVRRVIGRRKDGEEFPVELSVSMVRYPERMQFFGIVRDITEREEEMARLAQLDRLAAMGELAAGVAHEVNNPINTMINCAQLLKEGEDDPALLDDIVQEGMRIATIVRDLLNLASGHKAQLAPVSIVEVVERVQTLIGRRITKQGIRFIVELDADLPMVRGRSHQLQQVLLNIVLNARDALIEAGKAGEKAIRVRARCVDEGRSVEIVVRDNGPGIDLLDQSRIFQPFFTKKRIHGGTGLGLAVSLGIVKEHGGLLGVDSVPGEYAEFAMTLPAVDSD